MLEMPLKVAFVLPRFELTDQKYLVQVIQQLSVQGHTVEVLTTCLEDVYCEPAYAPGDSLHNGVVIRRFKVDQFDQTQLAALLKDAVPAPDYATKYTRLKAYPYSSALNEYLATHADSYTALLIGPINWALQFREQQLAPTLVLPFFDEQVLVHRLYVRDYLEAVQGIIFASAAEAQQAREQWGIVNPWSCVLDAAATAADWEQAISYLLVERSLAAQLSQKGVQRSLDFAPARIETMFEEFIDDVLESQPNPNFHSSMHYIRQQLQHSQPDYQIQSKLPVVAPFVRWARQQSTAHLKEPYLDVALQRQHDLNHLLLDQFEGLLAHSFRYQRSLEQRIQQLEDRHAPQFKDRRAPQFQDQGVQSGHHRAGQRADTAYARLSQLVEQLELMVNVVTPLEHAPDHQQAVLELLQPFLTQQRLFNSTLMHVLYWLRDELAHLIYVAPDHHQSATLIARLDALFADVHSSLIDLNQALVEVALADQGLKDEIQP